jgi:hypothetical protein
LAPNIENVRACQNAWILAFPENTPSNAGNSTLEIFRRKNFAGEVKEFFSAESPPRRRSAAEP